ncbi:hypothetical protein [Flavobacterium sp. N3904]|uniref:hypothetical protein n=1 Tax=Flavobacterium sp. N3904 TaxID=2986835 RepID=UPI0022248DC0|nr:hypothetical protein [Flavobacterium sp. N3904]
MPNSVATIHTATVYEANTFYTVQNSGDAAVCFSLSAATNQDVPGTVLLNPGETRSRLAENLTPMGVYFVVNNDNAIPAKKSRFGME